MVTSITVFHFMKIIQTMTLTTDIIMGYTIMSIIGMSPLIYFLIFVFWKGIKFSDLKSYEYIICPDRIVIFEEQLVNESTFLFRHLYSTLNFQHINSIQILRIKDQIAHIEFYSKYIKKHTEDVFYYKEFKGISKHPFQQETPEPEKNPKYPFMNNIPSLQRDNKIIFYYVELSEELLNIFKNNFLNQIEIVDYKNISISHKLQYWKKLKF